MLVIMTLLFLGLDNQSQIVCWFIGSLQIHFLIQLARQLYIGIETRYLFGIHN